MSGYCRTAVKWRKSYLWPWAYESGYMPSVNQALIWIAKLGGYIGRATDPPPDMIS